MKVVTTFSPKGYELYGKQMIESFARYWPEDVELYAFHEREKPRGASERAVWKSLDEDKDRAAFVREHRGKDHPLDYRFRPVRYSHKVWAYTSVPNDDFLIWLDADTITTGPVALDRILPPIGKVASYLARPYFRHSETGFIAFAPEQEEFLSEIRRIYTSGDLFYLPEWHDCAAFDCAVAKFQRRGFEFHNLCPDATDIDVFEQSPLAEFLSHNKGPVKKTEAYGAAI